MNIKPVFAPDTFALAASTETRDEAGGRTSGGRQDLRKKSSAKYSVPVPPPVNLPIDDSTGALRDSQTIDSNKVVELLSHRSTVNSTATAAFRKVAKSQRLRPFSDGKKLDKEF